MTRTNLARSALAAACGAAVFVSTASAAPPPNDNYLSSFSMLGATGQVASQYRDIQETAEATVQADLFEPDRDGHPLGGGPPETTGCGPSAYGRTLWYDFAPPYAGGARISASGFDTVVAVYEYDVRTARIVRQVICQDDSKGPVEELLVQAPAVKDHAYTVQVGGAAVGAGEAASGRLDFTFQFFRDTDGDGVLNAEPDRCPDAPGIAPSGCPPELTAQPRYTWAPAPGGIRLRSLVVTRVPAGARVEARCLRCGLRQVVKVPQGADRVRLAGLVGRTLRAGSALEILVTHPKTPSGRFRYGAIGNAFRFPVRANGLGERVDRCLRPGSSTPRRSCR